VRVAAVGSTSLALIFNNVLTDKREFKRLIFI
jgi:hypothetical protein